jgi:hypothetical protein
VRKIGPAGIITTIAGTGQAGFSGDGGPAIEAELNAPGGVALDRAGNLFIADSIRQYSAHGDYQVSKNNRIREVFGVAVPE